MDSARSADVVNVLVLGASEEIRRVPASWLRSTGHEVYEASMDNNARELLRNTRFALAIVATQRVDSSVFHILEFIRAEYATATVPVPVLLISATLTHAIDRIEAINRGADGYLVEPFDRDDLLANVTTLLRYPEALRSSQRLSQRLEHLHETTLALTTSSQEPELLQLAASGISDIYGAEVIVVFARGQRGRIAIAVPNSAETVAVPCSPEVALHVAESTRHGTVDITPLGDLIQVEGDVVRLGAPITTSTGELIGAIVLLTPSIHPEDELILDHISQTLAVTLENQRLLNIEHQIALTLQRSMLPKSIPDCAGLELAVRYQAASDTVEIGGDFYDVLEGNDGSTLIAIGDVVGHSLQAAVIMAELRHSLRAYISMGLGGSEIVHQIASLFSDFDPNRMATLCLVEISPDRCEIQVTNAGHVPPLITHNGVTRFVTEHGPLIGLRIAPEFDTVKVPFELGATVLLITDGLIERRDEMLDVGLGRLAETARNHSGTLDDLCEQLLKNVGEGSKSTDDIAIVVARRVVAADGSS